MNRRRWLCALELGLLCTVCVALMLFVKIDYDVSRSMSTEQNSRVSNSFKKTSKELKTTVFNFTNINKKNPNLHGSLSRMNSSKLEVGIGDSHIHDDRHPMENTGKKSRNNAGNVPEFQRNFNVNEDIPVNCIQLVIACCLTGHDWDRQQVSLTRTFLKSLLTFNKNCLHLHVFVTPHHTQPVRDLISYFTSRDENFTVSFYNASMPDISVVIKDGPKWIKNVSISSLFKPCSAQRLFLPYSLPHLKKVLYIDTDALILGPIDGVWEEFSAFNDSHVYGMTFISRHLGFYDKRPYYQPYKGLTGHNAGVMLMNLTKMREIDWYNITLKIIANLSGSDWVYASDQDVLNYYNGLNPGQLFEMSCAHNWRWSFCRKYANRSQECEEAHHNGITILHGVSGTFFNRDYFSSRIYRIFNKFQFGSSVQENLIKPIQQALHKYADYICAKAGDIYYKQMQRYVDYQHLLELH